MEKQLKNVVELLKKGEKSFDKVLSNEYVSVGLKIFLGLYAAMAAPQLPDNVLRLFDNVFVKMAWAAAIVMLATKKPDIALIVAIAFIMTLETLNKRLNSSNSYASSGKISWLESAKEAVVQNLTTGAPSNVSCDKPQQKKIVIGSEEGLESAQSNLVPNVDPQGCVNEFGDSLCVQGLEKGENAVQGYNPNGYFN